MARRPTRHDPEAAKEFGILVWITLQPQPSRCIRPQRIACRLATAECRDSNLIDSIWPIEKEMQL